MNSKVLAEKIVKLTNARQQRLIDLSKQLIDVPSVTGQEAAVQQVVRCLMEQAGLTVDYWEIDETALRKSELFSETNESFAGRPVVAGTYVGAHAGKSLLINCHVDVVNEQPIEKWISDPFKCELRDGKLYGRGTCDMKCGLASALFAYEIIRELQLNLRGKLTILSVPVEESSGNGTVASIVRGYTEYDAAIYPEPTSNKIQPAHRGAAFWRIHIQGKEAHGGTKYLGVSAIEKGILVAQKLLELETYRNEKICRNHLLYRSYPVSAPVTLGIFKGGQFTSAVAGACMLEGCIEYVPGEKSVNVKQMFEKTVLSVCNEDSWLAEHPPIIEWFGLLYEPAETPTNHPIVTLMQQCYQTILGQPAEISGFEAGTDMRLLTNHFGVPGLIFGAGDIMVAHAPNEHVRVDRLLQHAQVLALFMAEWCEI